MRKLKDYGVVSLKGMAMGAADVVPGVSGGTIAFISGIYEELIDTINRVGIDAIKVWRDEGFISFWKFINGNFLTALFVGILISVLSLAKVITYLLANEPLAIWSFFFGLVFASIFLVGKQVERWHLRSVIALVIGAAIAWYITTLPGVKEPGSTWYIFVSGALAICAMILPGISGSFILVLLGSYAVVLNSIHERDLVTIGVFAGGALVGLFSFARLLKWMFRKYHNATIALLTGFLVGSLNKVWPWKITISEYVRHKGTPGEKVIPILEENVLPGRFTEMTGEPSQWILCVALGILGGLLIWGLEFWSKKSGA